MSGGEKPDELEGTEAPFVSHLIELRDRLIRAVIAIAVAFAVLAIWPGPSGLYDLLAAPLVAHLPKGATLIATNVISPILVPLKITLMAAFMIALPVVLYQVWAFVAPGLTDSERRTARPWIPLALLFFALGVAVAYFILPMAVGFLLGFTDDRLVGNLAAGPYFDFVTTMFLAFGIVLEFPIVLYGLSRVGIVTSARLASSRRIAVLAIFVFAAGVTPGGDLVSPAVMFVTMYGLYEATIFFIRRSGK